MEPRRVVVTGMGMLTSLGNDLPATWQAILEGRSGIDYVTSFDASMFGKPVAGEVRDFNAADYIPAKRVRTMDRSTHLGVAAAMEALADAGLAGQEPLGPEVGVIFGTSIGGYSVLEDYHLDPPKTGHLKVSPFTLTGVLPDSTSGQVAILTGAAGPNMAILAASATGASALGEAAEVIKRGDAEVMIAGACEAPLTPVVFAGFAALRGMAEADGDPARACRPFDAERTGFVLAEGAGAMVLESLEHARARGATIYAELAGYGATNDAFHMVQEEPEGTGLTRAIQKALRKADIVPEAIGYVNAHGTASRMNDRVETLALKRVFGEHAYRLAVSSSKSLVGHAMSAAGTIEAVISVLALRDQVLPPTINYQTPDPECDLDYVPNVARPVSGLQAVLSESVGLGGHNAALIFRQATT